MARKIEWVEVRLNGKPMKTLPKNKAKEYAREIGSLGKVTMVIGQEPADYVSQKPKKAKRPEINAPKKTTPKVAEPPPQVPPSVPVAAKHGKGFVIPEDLPWVDLLIGMKVGEWDVDKVIRDVETRSDGHLPFSVFDDLQWGTRKVSGTLYFKKRPSGRLDLIGFLEIGKEKRHHYLLKDVRKAWVQGDDLLLMGTDETGQTMTHGFGIIRIDAPKKTVRSAVRSAPKFRDFVMKDIPCPGNWYVLSDGSVLYVEDSIGDGLSHEELEEDFADYGSVVYYTHVYGSKGRLDTETYYMGYNRGRDSFSDRVKDTFGAVPVSTFTLGDKDDDWQMHSDFENYDKDAIRKWLKLVPEFGDLRGLKL